jgi:hypothetical protein
MFIKNTYTFVAIFLLALTQNGQARNRIINFTSNPNFLYDHETTIVDGDTNFVLDNRVEKVAKVINSDLDKSLYFNTDFLLDVKKVRNYHLSKKKSKASDIGTIYRVTTADGKQLGCTFFNRHSDKVMFIAGGFTNERELMSAFISMFPDFDIVLMDWRGHGFNPKKTVINPIQKAFSISPKEITFGEKEHLDTFAVVEAFRQLKKHMNNGVGYDQVFGLGVCYGAFVFSKSASLVERMRFGLPESLRNHNPKKMMSPAELELFNLEKTLKKSGQNYKEIAKHGLFDKLILDGCWLSLPLFVEKIKNDIATLVNPQTGGLSEHWLFSKSGFKSALDFIATYVVGLQHHSDINLLDYVPTLTKTPLLFFFGKNDYMIRRHEFETLYNAIPNPEKTVVITSNHHVRNHWKQKELYKVISDLFLLFPHNEFIEYLHNPEDIAHYNTQHFIAECSAALEDRARHLLIEESN